MSGITYGQWWSQMRQQVANESLADSRRDLRTRNLELENSKLKEQVLALEKKLKTTEEIKDEERSSDRWA
jgi:hypothetical protein